MVSFPREPATQDSAADRQQRGRAAALRAEIYSPFMTFLMEAHSGLSAKIVEEAGFPGIWASGLSISASLGLRDSNEASWTQVLEVLEFMAESTKLPILVDGDTGYGNFNNVRRLVRKLCERRVAGVCIEDKLFPKTNSFVGERQPLAGIEEFSGRIKAGKDSQSDDDFVIVARTEALISGYGLDEALLRAEAYHAAGADAILIHSKQKTASEILAFAERWQNRCPLIIVPTTYHSTPTSLFRQAGISTVIWANHNLRAAITAMRDTSRRIWEDESLREVEGRVASVQDIFRLVGNAELEAAERRYLPARATASAVVLAASRGDLGDLTRDQPKCMIDVRGQSLLELLASDGDIVVAVDALGALAGARATPRDLVAAERPFSGNYLDDAPVHLRAVAQDLSPAESSGEWIGLARFTVQGAAWLREELDLIEAEGKLESTDMPMLITRLAAKHPVFVHYITGHWLDVDTLEDLSNARNFT